METSWFVVVNPRAGGGKSIVDWPKISRILNKYDIRYTHAFTEFKYHAVELTVNAVSKGYRNIIAVGGDGTLNEVINGIFIQKEVSPSEITIGVIGVGTGNDWFRMYDLPHNYEDSIKAIKNNRVFKQDVGLVEFYESGVRHKRYFVIAAGVGFDAEVALRTNRLKDLGKRGALLYILSLIKALIRYRTTRINVKLGRNHIQDKVFSITIGICRYNGAGMMQVPFALSDDGLFDVTIIKRISKLNVLANIHRLYNGTILKHSRVVGLRGSDIEIMSVPNVNLEVDGESVGETPLKFSILRQAISVIVSDSFVQPEVPQEKVSKHITTIEQ
ncbi:diacylglycerol kinase family protein [Tenuifilum sp.]|uniref:diacylglycerol/lipid kinase family protein n=1 Tax=Tenuifilum sp. TaxID=2760880 RepID=UPI002585957D|nr:diacylglycerol kinase family protein [Tenuifilum sp.]